LGRDHDERRNAYAGAYIGSQPKPLTCLSLKD